MLAAELMTKSVVTLTAEMNLMEMDTVLVRRGVSGAPVLDRERLIGVASQADIIRSLWQEHHEAYQHGSFYSSPFVIPLSALEYASRDAPTFANQLVERKVRDVMTRDPLVAHPEDTIDEIAKRMVKDQIHRLPITDRQTGDLVGVVTTFDLARAIEMHGLGDGVPPS